MRETITHHHLTKPAYLYLRQSTMGQVRHHRESTERQYALKEKACQLGWAADQVRILDGDLGTSGAAMALREDFKTLVADVSMGKVGAVFALEASRLSRSNTDWHRLLELCALTGTLIIDEDGGYDPADFNDQLLLGLKGTMSQAELHFLRARLQGGKLNKAKKGELRSPLPVGYIYDDLGRPVSDPDAEVHGAVTILFQAFRDTGSAYGVMDHFRRNGLLFPKRSYGGVWNGKLLWGRLSHSRVLGVLKNPAYAGVYVYGRYSYRKHVAADGSIQSTTVRKPIEAWPVFLKDHHEGYISWETYVQNQQVLTNNRTNTQPLPSAAREGLALVQGLLLCGRCARHVTARYKGTSGVYPIYECNRAKMDGFSTTHCLSVRSPEIDAAVSQRVLEVLQPAQLAIAVQAYEELAQRATAVDRQWQLKMERAEYEAQLAQRRYEEVDPANRLVAATLEQRWNTALEQVDAVKQAYMSHQQAQGAQDLLAHRDAVLALGQDLPRLWNAPTTSAKDRKRMLRLVIKDITIVKAAKIVTLQIRWHGGATEELSVPLRPKVYERWRHAPALVDRIRELAKESTDEQLVHQLNQEGWKTNKGNVLTVAGVQWIRYKHAIPAPTLQRAGELTVPEVAARFGVSRHVVYYWIARQHISARKPAPASSVPWFLTLDPQTEQRLRQWVEHSTRIAKDSTSQNLIVGGAL
jgi:DNA invertase Pin-like site-specific DNA recombinase